LDTQHSTFLDEQNQVDPLSAFSRNLFTLKKYERLGEKKHTALIGPLIKSIVTGQKKRCEQKRQAGAMACSLCRQEPPPAGAIETM